MHTRSEKKWKLVAMVLALLGLPLLAGSATAQDAPEEPIRGTIQVAEGDDHQALAKITMEEAREIALAEVAGAAFAEGELEEEDGYLVYDIELTQNGREIEVTVDAGDGSVLLVERDDEEDDDVDDDDDGWWIFK